MFHSAYSKALEHYQQRPKLFQAILGLLAVGFLAIVLINFFASGNHSPATYAAIKPMPLSRSVMLVAEEQVRYLKPAPTEAAREYAYVATVYSEALKVTNQSDALVAAKSMMSTLFPTRTQEVDKATAYLAKSHHLFSYPDLNNASETSAIIKKYDERNKKDSHDLKWDGVIPKGASKWIKQTEKDPLTPRAGDWERWIVAKTIKVSPPPIVGSAEDQHQMQIVAAASSNRTGEDVNKINFWGGTPGTDTPSGIWQNQMYRKVHTILPDNILGTDQKYSALQTTLAQTLSDAFMECWKVKYTYWTARPDMRDPRIKTAMHDPNFPGYISGHSTISKAAADTLSVLVPRYSKEWLAMAVEARQSRLIAGIHYDIDNEQGFKVGTQVAQQVIAIKNLQQIF
jgi:hypothetical protein